MAGLGCLADTQGLMAKAADVEGLSPALRSVYEAIRGLLAGAARDEARSRHQVGVLIAGVKRERDKYGARAVEQLASALGSNVHTLYRCAGVCECWAPDELEVLRERTTAKGQPLSWSHLVLLSGVTSETRRAELVDKALQDALTVRELLVLVDAVGRGETRGGERGHVVLRKVARACERWSQAAATMHEELLAELEGARSDAGGPTELIERAIAAQERLERIVQKQLLHLRAERGRFAPKKTAPSHRGRHLRIAGSTASG
jgi:hypothetical protein